MLTHNFLPYDILLRLISLISKETPSPIHGYVDEGEKLVKIAVLKKRVFASKAPPQNLPKGNDRYDCDTLSPPSPLTQTTVPESRQVLTCDAGGRCTIFLDQSPSPLQYVGNLTDDERYIAARRGP